MRIVSGASRSLLNAGGHNGILCKKATRTAVTAMGTGTLAMDMAGMEATGMVMDTAAPGMVAMAIIKRWLNRGSAAWTHSRLMIGQPLFFTGAWELTRPTVANH